MKVLIVFAAVTTTLLAASVMTDHRVSDIPLERSTDFAEPSEMSVIKESGGEIYEYPSMEDAAIILDISEDSLTHYILFQENPNGDEYKIE